jgi:hypothetical protein
MKSVLAVVAFALVVSLVLAPVASAQEKWVRGTVVSVAGDTVVVKALGKDMSFKVDKTTEVIARGAGTAQRKAEETGAPGVKLTDFVKPGTGVEIHYKDVGGTMTAVQIHTGLTVREGAVGPEVSGGSARGNVTAVGGASITVKGDAKEWTFVVDPKTTVVGEGLGTITKKFKEQGKTPTVPDVIAANDKVIVYYQEAGGALKATEIRVTAKAAK